MLRPGGDRAHAGAQSVDRLRGHGTDFEGAQVEIAGRPRRPPGRVLPLDVDHRDAHGNDFRAHRRHDHLERVAHPQATEQILAQIEREPEIVHVDQREQRRAGAEVLADLGDARGDLPGRRCVDLQLCDIDLALAQRGLGLLDLRRRERALLRARAGDGKLQRGLGRLALTDGGLQIVGRFVESRLGRVARRASVACRL